MDVRPAAKHAVEIDAHQGGKKDMPRAGANLGVVNHVKVDKIDHGMHQSAAKKAMADMGHENCVYYDGGQR